MGLPSLRLRRSGMRVPPPIPGGCEGEGQPARGAGSPPGSRFVCVQLEKNAAWHQNKRGQGRDPEVREQRSVKVPRVEILPALITAVFPPQWHRSAAVQWRVLWEVGILLPWDPFTLHGVCTETKDRRWLRLCSLSNTFSLQLGFSPTCRLLDSLLALQLARVRQVLICLAHFVGHHLPCVTFVRRPHRQRNCR